MNRGIRTLIAVGLGFTSALAAPRAAVAAEPTCQAESVPVHMSTTDTTVYQLAGWACWRGSARGKPVEVLVSGFTYDHSYWDFPLQPGQYSYVRAATGAGYVTFNVDRIGSGQSSHPPSALLTASAHVYVLHQVIAHLRVEFTGSPVVSVGHSAGSGTVLQEAADYADVDGVVLTGLLHQPNPAATGLFATFYPATLDPKFAAAGLDPGYLTTMPGTRGSDFYNTATADPAVIAEDEALKSTGSSTELTTGDTAFLPSTSQSIHVPVLLAVGQNDNSFCNEELGLSCASPSAVLARESADYSPDAHLEAFVLAGSGHVINLHPGACHWFDAVNDWVSRRIPSSSP